MNKPLADQGSILVPTPEQLALAEDIVQAHHQRSEDVLKRSETPEEAARFKKIGPYDTVPVPATTFYKDELQALIRFWENEVRDERFFQWWSQQGSTYAMRLERLRDDRIEQIAALIGIEAVREAIDQAFKEFDRDHRRPRSPEDDGLALWRCYLAERNPDVFGPASPEDLAELERFREGLHNQGE